MFNLEQFLLNPKDELPRLHLAKKAELLTITQKWQIPSESSYVKARLISDILQFLIAKNVVKESDEEVEEVRYLTGAVATKPEVFFDTFEDTATSLEWPAEHWVMLIRNGFKGKAAYVSSQMITVKDYQILKKAILDAYSITIEGYRQSFRNSQKSPTQTFVEFCDTKVRQFQKWIDKAGIKEFESLKSLVIMEEFLRKVPFNIANYILDKEETDLMKAASLADDYFLRHKSYKPAHNKTTFFSDRFCTYCKQVGHPIEKCPDPQCRKSEVKEHKPGKKQDSKKTMHVTVPTPDLDSFKPYTCQGSVNGKPVVCLRDTGSSQTIINLPPQELTMKQEYVAVTDLTSTKTLPLAEVTLQCPYYTGILDLPKHQ
ncbi:uncharacterized protein LOC135198836 [Macrobrachium nipponense]|uniref:uncharacterized protein LOC135198836 n=1 Tax=Macrobrachium nipponense TaxID=159736 RepID=UPI0030C7E54D